MPEDISRDEAWSALEQAAESRRRILAVQARWVVVAKLVVAALFAAVTLTWGFVGPLVLRTVLVFIVMALIPLWALFWGRVDRTRSRADRSPRRQWEGYVAAALFGVLVVAGDAVEVNGRDMAGRPAYWIPAAVLVSAPFLISAWRDRRGDA
ncbi:hypothetical protein ABZS66_40160 [Dactylosporangium sp. NPDC005572]|uniref:hypothetical protein n=1 Tax=Dactylosporangium sp. NPDC005572 TaxID=3156889 RepID=UPI0033A5CAF0